MSFEEEKDVSEELKEAQEVTADTAETKGKKRPLNAELMQLVTTLST